MIINPYSFVSYDADAQAFITAAGITDSTQKTAINTLVLDLKGYGVWNKMKAIYPFVGGTATTHKFNLKDPRDLDAAFRLTFFGGWVHSATGALPNGTNAYADTFFKPLTNGLSYTQNHIAFYSRTAAANGATGYFDMGAGAFSGADIFSIWSRRSADTAGYDSSNFSNNRITFANTDGRGFYCGTAISTTGKFFKNGTIQATRVYTAGAFVDANVYVGAYNEYNNSTIYYSLKEQAFSSIGDGLNDTESANFYTAVQAFQTTLSRQV